VYTRIKRITDALARMRPNEEDPDDLEHARLLNGKHKAEIARRELALLLKLKRAMLEFREADINAIAAGAVPAEQIERLEHPERRTRDANELIRAKARMTLADPLWKDGFSWDDCQSRTEGNIEVAGRFYPELFA